MNSTPVPDISHLSHAEQTIFSSIWNWPSLYAGMAGQPWPEDFGKDCDDTKSALTSVPYDGSDITKAKARTNVISNLFCTLGNGYHWKEGRLVCEEVILLDTPEDDVRKEEEIRKIYEDIGEHFAEQEGYEPPVPPDWISTRKFIADLIKSVGPRDIIYPMYDRGPLACIPDDITADWIGLAHEAISIVLAATSCGYYDSAEFDKQAIEKSHSIARVAQLRLKEIEERKA